MVSIKWAYSKLKAPEERECGGMERKDRRANGYFCLLQASMFCNMAVYSGFFSIILGRLGFDSSMIAQSATVISVCSMLLTPVMGRLCDGLRITRSLFLAAAVLSPVSLYFILHSTSFLGTLFWSAVFVSFCLRSQIMNAGWIAALNSTGYRLSFAFSRGIGSLSFALGSILIGVVMDRVGLEFLPVLVVGFSVVMAFSVLMLPPQPDIPALSGGAGTLDSLKVLCRNKGYLILILCSFLYAIPNHAFATFFAVYFEEQGGTSSMLGIAMFSMAVSEVPVMLSYGKLEARFGADRLMVVSLLAYGLKSLLVTFFHSPVIICMCLPLQAFALGLGIPTCQRLVAKLIEPAYSSTAQTTWSAASEGLGGICSSLLCTYLVTVMDMKGLLRFTALFSLTGAVIYVIYLYIRKRTEAQPEEAGAETRS